VQLDAHARLQFGEAAGTQPPEWRFRLG
jgi:hypothetical protein